MFTENLVDERLTASRDTSVRTSLGSDSDSPRKVLSHRHNIFTQFPKERNYEVWKRKKVTRTLCRRRTRNQVSRAEKFGDLITADHKVFWEDRVSWNNHWYAVVMQALTSQRLESYPCKIKSFQEAKKKFTKVSRSDIQVESHLYLTIHWYSVKHVKSYLGIIGHLRLIVPRQMILLKEQYAEQRKERLLYYCNQTWTKNDCRIPWNATAICERFKIYCRTGRHLMNDDLENLFGSMIEYHPISVQGQSRLSQFVMKVLSGSFQWHVLYATACGIQKNLLTEKWWNVHFSDRRWNSQVVWKRADSRRSTSTRVPPCTRRWAQRRASRRVGLVSFVRHADGWQWRPRRCLDDRMELLNQEMDAYDIGCVAGKSHLRWLECWWWPGSTGALDPISRRSHWMKNIQTDTRVPTSLVSKKIQVTSSLDLYDFETPLPTRLKKNIISSRTMDKYDDDIFLKSSRYQIVETFWFQDVIFLFRKPLDMSWNTVSSIFGHRG